GPGGTTAADEERGDQTGPEWQPGAGYGTAGLRTGAVEGGRGRVFRTGSAASRTGCVDGPECGQGGVRDQLHPVLLQVRETAVGRRDHAGHSRTGCRNR